MTARAATHIVVNIDSIGWSRTGCGKQGVREPGLDHYITGSNGHFAAVTVERAKEATCSKCRQRLNLASGGQDDQIRKGADRPD